ncbi:MAG: hypothetical protein WB952_23325 [Terriglobales bacterium]
MSSPRPANEIQLRKHAVRLRALSQQLGTAISAIEHNDLAQFESSIAAQELLCCELTGVQWPLATWATESAVLDDIRVAQMELAQLNRIYARVLKHAQKSAALMTALYRSFGQGYAEDAPPVAEKQTLSCEV